MHRLENEVASLPQAREFVGLSVRIYKDSEFNYQQSDAGNTYGKVTDVECLGNDIWYEVLFPNDYSNSYRARDLEFVNPKNNKEAVFLLEK